MLRKAKFFHFFCLALFLTLLFAGGRIVFAQSEIPTPTPTLTPSSSNQDSIQGLQDKIKEFEQKIVDLQGQEKTLSSQIKIMDSQIWVTELKIAEVKEKIRNLEKDILIAKGKIVYLQREIDFTTNVLIGRVVAVYELGGIDLWHMFFTSSTISNFLTRLEYLKIVQAHDKKTIYASQQAKVNYANEKAILEEKQGEENTLRGKLEAFTRQLNQEKKDKEVLLSVTKNSEKEYQKRLADALRELQQIQRAAKVLSTAQPIQVKRGDAIGFMGNTGYSFGAHLHFGVYDISSLDQYDYYSSYENPANVLESKSVDWNTECGGDPRGSTATGNGSFAWPMATDNLHITQGFGHTCYSDIYYRGNPHPAFDMYNNSDIIVRATEDGKAYFCRNCTGDGGNGVFIFHSNNKMTLYWHLQ